jgi:hypothetical protein
MAEVADLAAARLAKAEKAGGPPYNPNPALAEAHRAICAAMARMAERTCPANGATPEGDWSESLLRTAEAYREVFRKDE